MVDLLLDKETGDLALTDSGDISITDSVQQAVHIRLLWFLDEWRLGPTLGFPYFQQMLVKNPNVAKLKYLLRQTVLSVDEVTGVTDIDFGIDKQTRHATIKITYTTDEGTFREEVKI